MTAVLLFGGCGEREKDSSGTADQAVPSELADRLDDQFALVEAGSHVRDCAADALASSLTEEQLRRLSTASEPRLVAALAKVTPGCSSDQGQQFTITRVDCSSPQDRVGHGLCRW